MGVLHPAPAVRQQHADPTPAVRKVRRCPNIERHPGLRTTTFVTGMLMFVVGKLETSPAVTTNTTYKYTNRRNGLVALNDTRGQLSQDPRTHARPVLSDATLAVSDTLTRDTSG